MPDETLPRMGLGTVSDTPREWVEAVKTAFDVGYRHIDTAQMYDNEEYIGQAIRRSNLDREDLFIATKTIYREPFEDPQRNVPEDPNDVYRSITESLDTLGLEYVDLCYVHWPAGVYDPEVVWPQFEQAYRDGLIERIGVANFGPDLIEEAQSHLSVDLTANQVEIHPLLYQTSLVEHAQEHDYWLIAYSPLARGRIFDLPEIRLIAEKHGISPAQVSLAWILSKENVAAIPRSSDVTHQRQNFESQHITLDEEDLERLDNLRGNERIVDPYYIDWQ